MTREFESRRWFEREPEEDVAERAAMHCLAELPPLQREVIVLKSGMISLLKRSAKCWKFRRTRRQGDIGMGWRSYGMFED